MLDLFENFHKYMPDDKFDSIIACIKEEKEESAISAILKAFMNEYVHISNQLNKISSFDKNVFRQSDINDIDKVLENMKLEKTIFNFFSNDEFFAIVDLINNSIEELRKEAQAIKAAIGKLQSVLKKTISTSQKDINDFLEDPNTHNITSSDNSIASKVTLEDIFYQLGKLLVTIYNSNLQYEIPYNIYDDDSALNIEEIYQKIQKDLRYSEKEIIEKLLYYDESTTFETILKLSFFNSYNNINYNVDQTLLKANQNFANFYGKYNLLHSTIHFLHFGAYYKENQEYFEQLFNSFDNLNSEEIKIVQLATNIRSRMKNKFIPYEMMELISFFSNMKITFFNIDNFIKILISYDSELSQNHLKKAFEFLDMNHTGKLKISLLKEIFSLSFHGNRDEFEQVVNEIIEEVDKSEDHTISFNEFLYVLIKIE